MKRLCAFGFALSLLSMSALITSCGSANPVANNTSSNAPVPTTITSAIQAQSSASTALQASSISANASTTMNAVGSTGKAVHGFNPINFAPPSASALSKELSSALTALSGSPAFSQASVMIKNTPVMNAPATIPAVTYNCLTSGTITMSGTADSATGATNLTIVFNACSDAAAASRITGTMTVSRNIASATATTMSVTFGISGTPLTVSLYTDGTFAVKTADVAISAVMQDAYNPLSTTITTDTMTINGTVNAASFSADVPGENITFNNFSQVLIVDRSTAGTTRVKTTSNGAIIDAITKNSATTTASLNFTNFKFDQTYTAAYFDTAVNGTFSISLNPASCQNGTFSVTTATPVRYDNAFMYTTAGNMTLNSIVAIAFNANGSITVTYNGTTQTTYANNAAFIQVCGVL